MIDTQEIPNAQLGRSAELQMSCTRRQREVCAMSQWQPHVIVNGQQPIVSLMLVALFPETDSRRKCGNDMRQIEGLHKTEGMHAQHCALNDRANNSIVTNCFLSFIPNLDMSLLNRAQVLNIKQYHMRHGIHAKGPP